MLYCFIVYHMHDYAVASDSALADHCARLHIIFTYLLTYICINNSHFLQVHVVSDHNEEDSESPLSRRKSGRSNKRRVKDLSVCVILGQFIHEYIR